MYHAQPTSMTTVPTPNPSDRVGPMKITSKIFDFLIAPLSFFFTAWDSNRVLRHRRPGVIPLRHYSPNEDFLLVLDQITHNKLLQNTITKFLSLLLFNMHGAGFEPGTATRKTWCYTVTPLLPPMKIAFWCWIRSKPLLSVLAARVFFNR